MTVPQDRQLFLDIVRLLEPKYGGNFKKGQWFRINARSPCLCTEKVFDHVVFLSFDEENRKGSSNTSSAAPRVEVGHQAEVKERDIGNSATPEQKNAVVEDDMSAAGGEKIEKEMKRENDREWEMVAKEGGEEDWELI